MAGETFAYFLENDPNTTALPLPVLTTDRVAFVRSGVTYYGALPASVEVVSDYVVPVDGGTETATVGQGAFTLDPAGPLAALTVILPQATGDDQIFEVQTSQTITAFTASTGDGSAIGGAGPFVLAANGSVSWRYKLTQNKWFAR
jgi:hypothetical protein